MDSREVNKEIRASVRPVLKAAGFTKFTARVAWRKVSERVDVVSIQSFNSYNAGVLGCTTYSFAVRLGCYLLGLPPAPLWGQFPGPKGELPQEWNCHFRGHLERTFQQSELDRREIWYIDPDGRHLQKAIHDVRTGLLREALPWFERLSDRREVLHVLREQDMTDRLWGFGAKGSPARNFLLENLQRDDAA